MRRKVTRRREGRGGKKKGRERREGTRKREFLSSNSLWTLHKVIAVHIPLKLDEGKVQSTCPNPGVGAT